MHPFPFSVFLSASCLLLSRAAAGSTPRARALPASPAPGVNPLLPLGGTSASCCIAVRCTSHSLAVHPSGESGTVLPPVGSGSCGASRAVDTIHLDRMRPELSPRGGRKGALAPGHLCPGSALEAGSLLACRVTACLLLLSAGSACARSGLDYQLLQASPPACLCCPHRRARTLQARS